MPLLIMNCLYIAVIVFMAVLAINLKETLSDKQRELGRLVDGHNDDITRKDELNKILSNKVVRLTKDTKLLEQKIEILEGDIDALSDELNMSDIEFLEKYSERLQSAIDSFKASDIMETVEDIGSSGILNYKKEKKENETQTTET